MGNILIAYCLLGPQIEWILRAKDIGSQVREEWVSAVRIGDRFRIRVSGQQVQSVAETALELGLQCVIGGLAEVFQAAVRIDVAKLRKGP